MLRSKKGIFINQRKYILDLLAEIGMIDCKPADTSMVQNHGLQIVGRSKVDRQGEISEVSRETYLFISY